MATNEPGFNGETNTLTEAVVHGKRQREESPPMASNKTLILSDSPDWEISNTLERPLAHPVNRIDPLTDTPNRHHHVTLLNIDEGTIVVDQPADDLGHTVSHTTSNDKNEASNNSQLDHRSQSEYPVWAQTLVSRFDTLLTEVLNMKHTTNTHYSSISNQLWSLKPI